MADPVPGPKFFGPLLIAGDFEATLAFYRDRIGLPFEGAVPYAECVAERSRFAVVDARFWSKVTSGEIESLPGEAIPPSTILAIEVPDVDAVFERMMAGNVRFLSAPTDRRAMGLRTAFLRDPDGRTVELSTRLPAAG